MVIARKYDNFMTKQINKTKQSYNNSPPYIVLIDIKHYRSYFYELL